MKKLVCVMLALVAALGAVGCGEPKFEEVWIKKPEYGVANQVCVFADGAKTYFTGCLGLKQVGEREYEIWVRSGHNANTGEPIVESSARIILNEGGAIAIYEYKKEFNYVFVVSDTPNANAYVWQG